jgi:gluconolactonase
MKTTHAPALARWLFLVAGCALLGCSGGGGTPDASTAGAAGTGTAGAAGTGTAGTGTTGGSGGSGNAGTGGSVGGGAANGGTGGAAGTGGGSGGAGGRGGGAGAVGGSGGTSGGTGGQGGSSGRGGGGGTGGGGGGGTTGTGGSATRYTCPAGSFTTPNPSTITLTKVAGVPPFDAFNNNGNNFGNIEGTVWFGDALYVSEIGGGNNPPPARILRVPTTGAVSIAHATSGTNGLAVDVMGRLIGASHTAGGVLAFNLTNMTSTPIVSTYGSPAARFNTPNDLTVRSDGTIYFTDPDFQAPSPRPQAMTRVYWLAPGSTTAMVVDAGRSNPNGITLSLDEAFLFVTDGQGLWRYPVNADGSTGTATRIAQSAVSSGDGMGIDCAGTLYVTSQNRVVVVNPTGTGTMLGTISVNAQSATNVAFGGANHQTLYVSGLGNGTGGGATMGLFRADMPLPGMPF